MGEVEAKTGGDELNGDRGAHKKTKTKRARADEEKKGPQGPPEGSTPPNKTSNQAPARN